MKKVNWSIVGSTIISALLFGCILLILVDTLFYNGEILGCANPDYSQCREPNNLTEFIQEAGCACREDR